MASQRTVKCSLAWLAVAAIAALAGCGNSGGQSGLGAGAPGPSIAAGQVTFVNSCDVALTVHTTAGGIGDFVLTANGGTMNEPLASFNQGQANLIIPYPNTSASQCTAVGCDGWTALGGTPGTIQREGYMWDSPNNVYAAYCNPNLSGRGICALQNNCCGPGMVQDGTFGTTFELTPAGGGGNDYPDLSTNYGSGPHSPPNLCPTGGPDDCVTAAANIFFNVPIQWTTNAPCSFTTADQQVSGLQCLAASCPDAYQHPTDDKQCACPSSATRGYLVEFCPSGAPLPAIPTAGPAGS